MLTTIVHEDLVDWMTHEIECLAAEIFSVTPGCDWQRAIDEAFVSVVELLHEAEAWDVRSDQMRRNRREILLMRETNCSPEMAIDAIRDIDGKMPWSEVVTPFCFFCPGAAHNTDDCPKLEDDTLVEAAAEFDPDDDTCEVCAGAGRSECDGTPLTEDEIAEQVTA